jgi:hypothetical protein
MEPWRYIFRRGFAPLLSNSALNALQDGLKQDDPALVQGCVVFPKPMPGFWELPAAAVGLLAYVGREGEGLFSVFEVSEFHDRLKEAAAQKLGQMEAATLFLDWFDKTPRDIMRKNLLQETHLELRKRKIASRIREKQSLSERIPSSTNQ